MQNPRTLKFRGNSEDAFSLLELAVAVVILGLLVAIAIPVYAANKRESIVATIKHDVMANSDIITVLDGAGPGTRFVTSDEFYDSAAVSGNNAVTYMLSGRGIGSVACIWGSHAFGENDVISYNFSSETGKISEGGCVTDSPSEVTPLVVVGVSPVVEETIATPTPTPTVSPAPVVNPKGKYPVCHNTGNNKWHLLLLPYAAIADGHNGHTEDIIPPIEGLYGGKQWNTQGKSTFIKYCS